MIIDTHSHILPGIDDGSKNPETSLAMLQREAEQGVSEVFLTPHFYAEREKTVDAFIEKRTEAFNQLGTQYKRVWKPAHPELSLPKLRMGAEVSYFPGMSRVEGLEKLCITGTDLLLLELPFHDWGDELFTDINALQNSGRFRIVLAHLERFTSNKKNREYIREFQASSCLVQVNAESFLNPKTQKKVLAWFKAGYVDFLGSDAHGVNHRVVRIEEARNLIREKLGDALMERFDARAERYLKGKH